MKRLLHRPLPHFSRPFSCHSALACSPEPAGPGGAGTGGAAPLSSGGASNGSGGNLNTGGSGLGATGGALSSGGTGDASSGGAGATDAGSGGAGADSGGSLGSGGSSQADVLFMSDFESDATGKVMKGGVTWTTTLPTEFDSMGVVEIVEGQAHSGNKMVRVVKGTDGQAFLQLADASVFPFAGSVLFVRAFIKVAIWPENHASWIEVGAAKNETSEIRLGAHQGVLQLNYWSSGAAEKDQIAPGVAMTTDTWHCLEMSYEPGQKTVRVWLDDVAVPALSVMGSFATGGTFDPAPPIEAVRFGAEIAATEAWFDDIAVGTEHIGCD